MLVGVATGRAVGHVRHRRRGGLDARDPGSRRDRAAGDRLDPAVDPAVVDLGIAALPPREHDPARVVVLTSAFGVPASVVGSRLSGAVPGQRARTHDPDRAARRVHRLPHRVPDRPHARTSGPTARTTSGGGSRSSASRPGALSGLLGIGGGILMVPAFSAWVGMPLKQTIATSLACVGIFAIPGTLTHWYLGHIDWTFAIALVGRRDPGRAYRRALHDQRGRQDVALQRRRRARDHLDDLRRRRSARVDQVSDARTRRTPRRAWRA